MGRASRMYGTDDKCIQYLGKSPLGIPKRRWQENMEINLNEMLCENLEWIHLVQGRVQWRENGHLFSVSIRGGEFIWLSERREVRELRRLVVMWTSGDVDWLSFFTGAESPSPVTSKNMYSWRWLSSGLLHRVVWYKSTDVSEELACCLHHQGEAASVSKISVNFC
jgi:hypothetical protein